MSRLLLKDVQADCESVGLYLARARAADRREGLAKNEPVPHYVATYWTLSPPRFQYLDRHLVKNFPYAGWFKLLGKGDASEL